MQTTIPSRRLLLSHATLEQLETLIERPTDFVPRFGWQIAPEFIDFPGALEFSLKLGRTGGEAGLWWVPYLVIHRVDQTLIGICGFKGPISADGMLEIGYSIAPDYRRQGLATETAAALVRSAFEHEGAQRVIAHTLPQLSASTRVLSKCGFQQNATIHDLEDGDVWRWELSR